jgi:uncharacterized protein (TIGR00730 family)
MYKIISKNVEKQHPRFFVLASGELSRQTSMGRRFEKGVNLFGSARVSENHPSYQNAMKFADRLSRKGYTILSGGGPGIMEAANRGALKTVGLGIDLPQEQGMNHWVTDGVTYKYFFTRKLGFLDMSDASVSFTGGFGTMDEFFEVMSLKDKGFRRDYANVLFGESSYGPLYELLQNLEERKLLRRPLSTLATLTDSLEEAESLVLQSKQIDKYYGHSTPLSESLLSVEKCLESLPFLGPTVGIVGSHVMPMDLVGQSTLRSIIHTLSANDASIIFGGNQEASRISSAFKQIQQSDRKGNALFLQQKLDDGLAKNLGDRVLKLRVSFEKKIVMTQFARRGHLFFPGGTGTMDHLFEVLTLMQTQKIRKSPIVLLGKDFWQPWADWFKEGLLKEGTISATDLDLFKIVDHPDDALEFLNIK